VHALRHVHELLAPGGTMVDLHPVTEEQVEAEGRIVGVIRELEYVTTHLPNAEARLRQAIDEGLYALETEISFDVLQHFDRHDELLDAKDALEGQDALIRMILEASPPLVIREHVVLRRLRALPVSR
jgi:hypothetical protein